MRSVLLLLGLLTLAGFTRGQDTTGADTLSDRPAIRSARLPAYAVPALLISYGFAALSQDRLEAADRHFHHEIVEHYPNFSTTIESKLQYTPVAAVYALELMGVKGKHRFIDRTGVYLIANTLSSLSVDALKDKTHRLRPSGLDNRSFPSGHTANAFLAAEFLRQEYQDESPWIAYGGYAVAAATGTLRLMNNDHWFSDVVAGAGVGILSARVGYAAYPWLKEQIFRGRDPAFLLLPGMNNRQPGYVLIIPLEKR